MSSSSSAAAFQEMIRKSTTGALDRAKLVLGRGENSNSNVPESESIGGSETTPAMDRLEELSEYCPQLTFQQRLIGFAASFSLGYLIAFFSFRFFIRLLEGRPMAFALNYTFGHILQLLASTFLCGPKRQFKNMFDATRRLTSITYLSCLAGTLFVVFLPLPKKVQSLKLPLLMILMLVQFAASVWYTLSYIPYGRRTATRCIKRQLGMNESPDYAIPSFSLGAISGSN